MTSKLCNQNPTIAHSTSSTPKYNSFLLYPRYLAERVRIGWTFELLMVSDAPN